MEVLQHDVEVRLSSCQGVPHLRVVGVIARQIFHTQLILSLDLEVRAHRSLSISAFTIQETESRFFEFLHRHCLQLIKCHPKRQRMGLHVTFLHKQYIQVDSSSWARLSWTTHCFVDAFMNENHDEGGFLVLHAPPALGSSQLRH